MAVLAVAALLFCATPPAPAGDPSILVWTLKAAHADDEELARVLTNQAADALRRSGDFARVVSDRDVQDMLSRIPRQKLDGCVECILAIERALDVDYVMTGRLSRIDGHYVVNVKLIETRTATVVSSANDLVTSRAAAELLTVLDVIMARIITDHARLAMARTIDDVVAAPVPDDEAEGSLLPDEG